MLKNQELAKQIFEILNTGVEASNQMLQFLQTGNKNAFNEVCDGLYLMIQSVRNVADELKREEEGLTLPAASESVLVSIKRIKELSNRDANRAVNKIEFELIPLIEEMRVVFYYWGMVYPDKEKMQKYYEEDIHWLADNKYQSEALRTGKYKYDLSIIILAYNKLDYTMRCVANLLKHMPKNLTYEFIFMNHGSSDGTKAFFEKLQPHKQIDIEVNGGGLELLFRIAEGKYVMTISNDVMVQDNSIQNLYDCIDSDETIAWVVPSTSNVSNLQTIPAVYNSEEELEVFCKENNIPGRSRWEQRVRLCNPIDIVRGSAILKLKPAYTFQSRNRFSFPDDKLSLLCRRNGYKMYLVKNAYCHHFGSMTLKEDERVNSQRAFLKGREAFVQFFGVDPWGRGLCFEWNLFQKLVLDKTGEVSILGINCGFGSDPLKIKEELKEKLGNEAVTITNITTNANVLEDLRGVSEKAEYVTDYHVMKEWNEKFDYIVAYDFAKDKEEFLTGINILEEKSKEKGIFAICLTVELATNLQADNTLSQKFMKVETVESDARNGGQWLICYKY